jgi:hypothetical protein
MEALQASVIRYFEITGHVVDSVFPGVQRFTRPCNFDDQSVSFMNLLDVMSIPDIGHDVVIRRTNH